MIRFIISVLALTLVFSCKSDNKKHIEEVKEQAETLPIKEEGNISNDSLTVEVEKSVAQIKAELKANEFQFFDYVDEKTKDTIIMQQYYIAFLKAGDIRTQNEEELQALQEDHLAHLQNMYDLGYADISGPFDSEDTDIKGITIYNTPNIKIADSLANADPMVKAGRLKVEVYPWWAGKGFKLR